METSFEALPPRDSKRLKKRQRTEAPESSGRAGPSESSARLDSGRVIHDTTSVNALQYEFLDHTADVQLHAWGDSLAEAFAHCALAQWGYMTDPASIKIDPECDRVIEASGRDPITLLYAFLDKCLYEFTGDDFLAVQLQVLDFIAPQVPRSLPTDIVGPDADDSHRPESCYIRVSARGERFVFGRHPQGTEVKAVTFSNMQIVVDVSEGVGAGSGSSSASYLTPYSGVSLVNRGGASLLQYSANDDGAEVAIAAAGGSGGQDVAIASAEDAAVAGARTDGIPGLAAPELSSKPASAPADGDEESVCTPAGAAVPAQQGAGAEPEDGHAGGALLGTRRGPVDVYVIVDI